MTVSPSWKVRSMLEAEKPFTSGELAKLFNVDPKTVTRWASSGKIESFRTVGGHRRFTAEAVRAHFVKLGLRYPGRIDG